jgi:hypothetical protein
MIRTVMPVSASLALIATMVVPSASQSNPALGTFFRQNIGLNQDQIAAIRNGQPVAITLPPRTPDEFFLFGAVYIHASPEAYLQLVRDVGHLRKLPNYLALGVFGEPPQLSHLEGFSFDDDDIQALKKCRPGGLSDSDAGDLYRRASPNHRLVCP